ncbi:hypothetical protein PG991_016235 [Apiospora marii]|uniref:Uncharacterized protein n=1 Tax=Apiospora marii TaxID=335849 RepID=A0ABR1R2T3_9PEZI
MLSLSTTLRASCVLPLLVPCIYATGNSEDDGDFGFWDIPKDQFQTNFNHPNATGAMSLPINGGAGGWSLSVQVAADVPIAAGGVYGGEYGTFFTGSRVLLNAPIGPAGPGGDRSDSSDDEDAASWQTCTIFWDLVVAEYPDELREDDGSCSSGLSNNCINAIERQMVHDSSPRSCCTCPQLDKIDACKDSKLWKFTACGASRYNKTRMASWPNGQLEVRRYGGPRHDQPRNLTAYNETGSIAWPVAVVRKGEPPAGNSGLGGETTAKLACVRADKAAEGDLNPGKPSSTADGKSSGSVSAPRDVGQLVLLSLAATLAMVFLE